MRLLKATIISLLFLSCKTREVSITESRRDIANDDVSVMETYLLYYKDDATNLCFAGCWLRSHGAVLTNISCDHVPESKLHHFSSR